MTYVLRIIPSIFIRGNSLYLTFIYNVETNKDEYMRPRENV